MSGNKNLSSTALKPGAVEFKGASGTSEYDAELWLVKFDRVCEELTFTTEEKFRCAVALLQDEAYQWWKWVTSHLEQKDLTWEFFKKNFEAKYIGSAYLERKRKEFMNLQQGSMTVQEYESEFVRLSIYAPELVPSEAIRCERFVNGLENEFHTTIVAFNNTVFSTLQYRVLKIVESRNRSKGPSEQEKSQLKRPAGSVSHFEFSKRAKEAQPSGRTNSHQFRRNKSKSRQPPSASVASTGASVGRRASPLCDYCRRPHLGVCWKKSGACMGCGTMNHFIQDCPTRPTTSVSVASTGSPDEQPTKSRCDFCKRLHFGECWKKHGACIKWGSTDHIIHDCPELSTTLVPAQFSAPAAVGRYGGFVGQLSKSFCDFCKKHHLEECWNKFGACRRCGSTDHLIRDCPKNSSAPTHQ